MASTEVELARRRDTLDDIAEGVVIAAVLGDAALAALLRPSQEDRIVRRLGPESDAD